MASDGWYLITFANVHTCTCIYSLLFQVREITHLQYSEWPDHGIPEDPQPFLGKCIEVLVEPGNWYK